MERLHLENFRIIQSERRIAIHATVVATWCTGSPTEESESGKAALRDTPDHFKGVEKEITKGSIRRECTFDEITRCKNQSLRRFFSTATPNKHEILPCNICTLLSATFHDTQDEASSICCILVSRFLKKYNDMISQFVICIRVNVERLDDDPFRMSDVQDVSRIPKLIQRRQLVTKASQRNMGYLKEGRPYVIYRILLYCEDFKQSGSAYSQASCGGVYTRPIGMKNTARRSRTAVHVISLSRPGVSTNEVLHMITSDIVKGNTGIEGTLPSGDPVVIFLDVVGFIADYPAAAEAIEILGHMADAPCTHCTIRKVKNEGSSEMGFTSEIHTSNTLTLRCAERHNALRNSDITDKHANILGMQKPDLASPNIYPFSVLRDQLLAVRPNIPLTTGNVPVRDGIVRSISFKCDCP